jgi:hypothetical protein
MMLRSMMRRLLPRPRLTQREVTRVAVALQDDLVGRIVLHAIGLEVLMRGTPGTTVEIIDRIAWIASDAQNRVRLGEFQDLRAHAESLLRRYEEERS